MPTLNKMTLKQLANIYNDAAIRLSKSKVKKFSDRKSAIRRVVAIRKELLERGSRGAGRPSAYEGKFIYPLVDENPRRKGSHGFRSFRIILKKPGIAYEDFIKAGGLSHGLRWDLERSFVAVRDE